RHAHTVCDILCSLFPCMIATPPAVRSTLSLHDALPICKASFANNCLLARRLLERGVRFVHLFHEAWDQHGNLKKDLVEELHEAQDRKSTRLNSSHDQISYAVFCLKKKQLLTRLAHIAST